MGAEELADRGAGRQEGGSSQGRLKEQGPGEEAHLELGLGEVRLRLLDLDLHLVDPRELLADIADLHRAGCVAITDDGHPTATAMLMRRAFEYAGMFGMPVIEHCEDTTLKGDGVAHEGFHAAALGLRGIPGACEAMGVERGILMAELTNSHFHVAHMSARASIRGVRKAKEAGIKVSCEVAPHHFTLTDEALGTPIPYDTNTKMNPPLREVGDRDSMLAGIADGSIDCIATDHAPHHYDEKKVEFDRAPFGIVGLETAVSLSLDRLYHAGHVRMPRLIELLSVNPARILKVAGGTLSEGVPADITIIAPDMPVRVQASALKSKSKNTPFDGWELRGGVAATGVAACAACHGPNGAGIPAQYPRVAGQFADYTLAQLKAFAGEQRTNDPGKVMQSIAVRMTDKEMRAVAEYTSGLR